MWSASGLLGSRPASQVRRTWQSGQCSSPAARALRLAAAEFLSQRVVPVREVVTCPPRARAHAGRVVLLCTCGPRRFSPFPSPQKGGNSGAQSPRGRLGSAYVRMMRVSVATRKWWHVWACCGLVTGYGLSVVGYPHCCRPSLCVDPPAPCLMGVPLFGEGVGCLLQPPSLLWPTPLFVCTPWTCPHCVWGHTLKPSGTPDAPTT